MYVCVCIYIYIYVCVCMYLCVYVCVYMYVNLAPCGMEGVWLNMFERKILNPLKTKRRLLYLKTQFVPRCKHFSSRL